MRAAQIVRQLSPAARSVSQHGIAAVFEFAEVSELLFNRPYLDLIQIAGHFFAIARDEGHRAALVEELNRLRDCRPFSGTFRICAM